jgi:DNA polymerase V
MRERIFAIIDCNNFYVSCERLFNPKLKNVPVGVLSNNDGIIVARSNEIKALGIPMGAPVFKYRDILKENNAVLLSSNYMLYGDMSWRVMETLKTFTNNIEIYSIDEAFLEISNIAIKNYVEFGQEIRRKVLQWIGIPVSVGIASTKTLAKVANRYAKKNNELNGVCSLINIDANEILDKTNVKDIWGVGFRNAPKLGKLGITTALGLKNSDSKQMRKKFSVMLERTIMELNGVSCIPMNQLPSPKNLLHQLDHLVGIF